MDELGKIYICNNDFSSFYSAHYISLKYRTELNGSIPETFYQRIHNL